MNRTQEIDSRCKPLNDFLARKMEKWGMKQTSVYSFSHGKKYTKVLEKGKTVGEMVYCFIEISTGNIFKPKGYNAPDTKHIRGNIFDESTWEKWLTPFGVEYIK